MYSFGATACPAGTVSKTALGAELTQALKPHEACLSSLGIGTRQVSPRGQVVNAAMTCVLKTVTAQPEATCVAKAQADVVRELVAVIKILCTYPENDQLVRTCNQQVKQSAEKIAVLEREVEVLRTRPESCPTCPPAPMPRPCPACAPPPACPACAPAAPCPACAAAEPSPKGVSYGIAAGLAAAAAVTGYVVHKLRKKKR